MRTESMDKPPFVCVQSIWVNENFIFVGVFGSSTTKSPTWWYSQFPVFSKKRLEMACWPSGVVSWNWTGFMSHPWTLSWPPWVATLRPGFFVNLPSRSLNNNEYVPAGNWNSMSPSTSSHQICCRYAIVWNLVYGRYKSLMEDTKTQKIHTNHNQIYLDSSVGI